VWPMKKKISSLQTSPWAPTSYRGLGCRDCSMSVKVKRLYSGSLIMYEKMLSLTTHWFFPPTFYFLNTRTDLQWIKILITYLQSTIYQEQCTIKTIYRLSLWHWQICPLCVLGLQNASLN
jgi:hypothetical protein